MAPRHPPNRDQNAEERPWAGRPGTPSGDLSPIRRSALSDADRTLLERHIEPLTALPDRPRILEQLEQYFQLLLAWNRRSNLISRGDEPRVITRHALDSLAAIPVLDEIGPSSILDLGSGAGLPGIPIKILRSAIAVTLLDSRRMKTLFLLHAVRELGLSGVRVWRGRVEDLGALPIGGGVEGSTPVQASISDLEGPLHRPCFDTVVARAVASLEQIARWAEPLLAPGGYLLAHKGSRLDSEIADWKQRPGSWRLVGIHREVRPQTHLIVLRRS